MIQSLVIQVLAQAVINASKCRDLLTEKKEEEKWCSSRLLCLLACERDSVTCQIAGNFGCLASLNAGRLLFFLS